MKIDDISSIIPHRHPFLFIDEIIELVPGKLAVGIKRVTAEDVFLQTGALGKQALPSLIVLEAMAQVGAVAVLSCPRHRNKNTLMAGINKAHFFMEVIPGHELRLEAEITHIKGRLGRRKCRALVGDTVAAEAEILFALV